MESDNVGWKCQLRAKTKAQCVLDFREFKAPTLVPTVYFEGCQYLR